MKNLLIALALMMFVSFAIASPNAVTVDVSVSYTNLDPAKEQVRWNQHFKDLQGKMVVVLKAVGIPAQEIKGAVSCLTNVIQETGRIPVRFTCHHSGRDINMLDAQNPQVIRALSDLSKKYVEFCASSTQLSISFSASDSQRQHATAWKLLSSKKYQMLYNFSQDGYITVKDSFGQQKKLSGFSLMQHVRGIKAPVWTLTVDPRTNFASILSTPGDLNSFRTLNQAATHSAIAFQKVSDYIAKGKSGYQAYGLSPQQIRDAGLSLLAISSVINNSDVLTLGDNIGSDFRTPVQFRYTSPSGQKQQITFADAVNRLMMILN